MVREEHTEDDFKGMFRSASTGRTVSHVEPAHGQPLRWYCMPTGRVSGGKVKQGPWPSDGGVPPPNTCSPLRGSCQFPPLFFDLALGILYLRKICWWKGVATICSLEIILTNQCRRTRETRKLLLEHHSCRQHPPMDTEMSRQRSKWKGDICIDSKYFFQNM